MVVTKAELAQSYMAHELMILRYALSGISVAIEHQFGPIREVDGYLDTVILSWSYDTINK